MYKFYPVPEKPSELYSITIGGEAVPANPCRVSAIPFNVVWPGHQRALEQTEEAAFLAFEADGEITLKVKTNGPLKPLCADTDIAIRPLSRGIKAAVAGDTAEFTLPGPGQYTFEPGGINHALHIFVDPPKDYGKKEGEGIIYYGPGIHDAGRIELKSNQTLYIDAGAIVYGGIIAEDAENIRIVGRGILDNSKSVRGEDGGYVADCGTPLGCIKMYRCKNVLADGVIFRDSGVWTATLFNCDCVTFDNIKAIGMWRYNSDGIDFVNSANGLVQNSFLRCFDDVIVLKGLKGYDTRNVENILVRRCVTWCDWGRNLEIGAETCADEYRNIIFEDCDCIHGAHIMLDIQNGDRARVHNLIFDNIRCEYSKYQLEPIYQGSEDMKYEPKPEPFLPTLMYAHLYRGIWSKDMLFGENYDITFRNIQIIADPGLPVPPSGFVGAEEEHKTHDIKIEGLYFNGKRLETLEEARVSSGDFTENITIE